ncbi:MAG TPA: hypothetical protein VFI91_09435 [Longimicrobiaceae bacterium]|nr:hypothetical protein [Longimicrobiaceae bacterium]
MRIWIALLVLSAALLVPAKRAYAQDPGPMLLPPGVVRLGAAGIYNELPVESHIWPLHYETFAPLRPVGGDLIRFFEETGGAAPVVTAEDLTAGELELGLSGDARTVPFSLAIGVLPRLELGVRVPVTRGETAFRRYQLTGGNVGLNSEAEFNAGILSEFATIGATLGGQPLLPTDGSPLGQALQARVVALTGGDSLRLPDNALTFDQLRQLLVGEFGPAPLTSARSDWALGDAEITARIGLFDTSPDETYPTNRTGFNYRGVASVAVRLPTGTSSDPTLLFSHAPIGGLTGYSVGLRNDLFYGDNIWLTASAEFSDLLAAEVERRLVSPDQPLADLTNPALLSWAPPTTLRIDLSPRYRLTSAISLGLRYALVRQGESTYEMAEPGSLPMDDVIGPAVLNTAATTAHLFGAGVRFTTIPNAFDADGLPFEIGLNYLTGIGDDGPLAGSTLTVQGSLFHRFWGGG